MAKKFVPVWKRPGKKSLPHGKSVRVSTVIDDYMRSSRFHDMANSSKRMYFASINALEQIVMPNGKSIIDNQVHEIDYGMCDHVKRTLGFTLKPATIALYFSMFSSAWDVALRNGKAAYNPWSKSRMQVNNIREITWSNEQIRLAVDTCHEFGFNLLALYILIAYQTAQRPWSDLRNMKWSNLKLDNDGKFMLDFTIQKTKTHILVPLSDEVASLLNNLPKKSDYIFVDENGKHLSQTMLTTQFNKVKKYAKLDPALLIRDLRRTAVTEMAQSGATALEIQAITGWRVTDRMLNRYAVLKLGTAKNCLEKRTTFQKAQNESGGIH